MSTIVTRSGKGAALTHTEVDANFTNLNADKAEVSAVILATQKGAASGVAPLDATSKISSTYLPSYVDDVLEYANYAALPVTGETGKIYVALDTNKTYRWSGSAYVYITSGAVDSVAGKTGVVTLAKADVGLSNVDNTTDALKPVSTATQTALDLKSPIASPTFTGTVNSANLAYTGTLTGGTGVLNIGSGQIYKDASGNVGIGTSSPGAKLTIQSSTNNGISVNDGAVTTVLYNTSSVQGSVGTTTNHPMTLWSNNAERMRIDSSGNVGIGTSSPLSTLHVIKTSSGVLTTGLILQNSVDGNAGGINSAIELQFAPSAWAGGSGLNRYSYIRGYNGGAGNPTYLVFGTNSAASDPTERMRIDSSGNVGIGTSSPASYGKLAVIAADTGTALSLVSGTGNLVYAAFGGSGFLQSNNSLTIGCTGASPLTFRTNSLDRLSIDSSGNVGIGTTAPNASAILDAQSTTKGVRFPNMTTTQKTAVATPAAGLVVFDTTLAKLCVYSGAAWQTITSI